MAEKSIKQVGIRQRDGSLGTDYEIGFDFIDIVDTDRENATNYSLKDFLNNYIEFQENSYVNVFTKIEPKNSHVGIWFDTGHTNQEFPEFSTVTFNGNGGTWTWGVINDTEEQTIKYLDKFVGPVPRDIKKENRVFLGWYVDEIDAWTKVEDVLTYPIQNNITFVAQWAKLELSAENDFLTTRGKTLTIPVTTSFVAETEGIATLDLNVDLTSEIKVTIDSNIGYAISRQGDSNVYDVDITIPQTANAGDIIHASLMVYDQKIDFNITIEKQQVCLVTKPIRMASGFSNIILSHNGIQYPNIDTDLIKMGDNLTGRINLNSNTFYVYPGRMNAYGYGDINDLITISNFTDWNSGEIGSSTVPVIVQSDGTFSMFQYQKYITSTYSFDPMNLGAVNFTITLNTSRIPMIDAEIVQEVKNNIGNIAFAVPAEY